MVAPKVAAFWELVAYLKTEKQSKQVPDAILKVWSSCISIPTLLAIRVHVAQWLERPNENSEGRESDSHLELGKFSELSGV